MQHVWPRTYHDLVPAADTSSGSNFGNSKYCGGKHAPDGVAPEGRVASWDRGSRESYGMTRF